MKKLFPFLALLILAGCQPVVKGQWVNSVPTIDDLLWLNAYDTHSNVVAVCGTTKGDNLGGLFSFYRGAVDPTNDMAHFGPFESLNPASPAGRWICTIQGANTGGTNIFNYLIVTNLTVINNLVTTNFFITNITAITTNSITFFTNVYITNANIYLNGTNIPAINPTMGYVPYNQDGTNFGDSPIYVLNTNTIQVYEVDANDVLVTNLQTGGVVISLLSGEVTNLVNGTGALTNDGAGNLGWFDVGGFSHWTNDAGLLRPVDLTLPIYLTNQIVWGPGTTNVLYRKGDELAWTNAGVGTFSVAAGGNDDKRASLAVTSAGATTLASTNELYLRAGGGYDVRFNIGGTDRWQVDASGGLNAILDNTYNIGGKPAQGTNSPRSIYSGTSIESKQLKAWSYWPDNSNYSWLSISQADTNSPVVFDVQTAGTAGYPRPIDLDFGSTNLFTFDVLNDRGVFTVRKATGESGRLQMSTGGHLNLIGGSGSDLFFGVNNNGSGDYSMNHLGFIPVTTDHSSLGSAANSWKDLYLTNGIVYMGTNQLTYVGTDLFWNGVKVNP